MPTVAESLQRHNIALSKEALVAALRNPDEDVRALAALQLAQDKATDTGPAVAEALSNEKVPKARLDIAMALAQLGDERGSAALTTICKDSHANTSLRLAATINLLNLGDDSCQSAVVDTLRSKADHDYLTSALALAPRFRHDSEGVILGLVAKSLNDKAADVRISAGAALSELGQSPAIPYLENAIGSEQDETVRMRLETDLQRLRKKVESH